MRLKLFRAASMTLAMAQVRRELGDDALILATRRVGDGVEITAAQEPDDPPQAPPLPPRRPCDPERLAVFDFHAVPTSLRDALSDGDLAAALTAALPFNSLPLQQGGHPLLLVGPPGAGKTLTVAKLATRLVIAGTTPIVITADGQRAGATEQLAAFTRLLGINLTVACHPVTLGRVLATRQNGSPVLIDSPGCDPFDATQRDELAALAATANAVTVLVLPAGLDTAEATDLASAFASVGASLLVATRLDLVRRLGSVLAAAGAPGLALTEGGIGPGAADGLVPLSPGWLAARLFATCPLAT